MEFTLHRQLKALFAGGQAETEVRVGGYRVDAICDGELIEIQQGPLAAIRHKVDRLLAEHHVRVVKPIVATKHVVRLSGEGGTPVSRRRSPKRGTLLEAFNELVSFVRVFPHVRLTLELLLVDVEELRYSRPCRRRYRVEDRRLLQIVERRILRTAGDLVALLPANLPGEFDTLALAQHLGVPRHVAQRVAYCLRKTRAAETLGRRGRGLCYMLAQAPYAPRRAG
jgi:hypothetical protein